MAAKGDRGRAGLPADASHPVWVEANFDTLAGPTHHFGGLSPGNLLSQSHQGRESSPRQAALQGLAKCKLLADLGIPQAVLPPAPRPDFSLLESAGFVGPGALAEAAAQAPLLLRQATSSASMWTANMATVIPSAESHDGLLHLVPANLNTMLHRSGEWRFSWPLLARLFANQTHFAVHPPLPSHPAFADEGDANHIRLIPADDRREAAGEGLHLFVVGFSPGGETICPPRFGGFPARQSRETALRMARLCKNRDRVVLIGQHPKAIAGGVFHNDVAAMSHQNRLCVHQRAWSRQGQVLARIQRLGKNWLEVREVTDEELALGDAVKTYLFNSQVVSPPGQNTHVIMAPLECSRHPKAVRLLDRLVEEGWAGRVEYLDLTESMGNGGGPACLRLRVPMNNTERQAVAGRIWLDDDLYRDLTEWVSRHYRERLTLDDLADPSLALEAQQALDQLTRLLRLGNIYPFQQ